MLYLDEKLMFCVQALISNVVERQDIVTHPVFKLSCEFAQISSFRTHTQTAGTESFTPVSAIHESLSLKHHFSATRLQ